jgi:hypothetical protein
MYNPPAHMSYSQATAMLQCGQRYKLERLMGAPSVPSWSLVGGSVVHEVTEQLDRVYMDPSDVHPEEIEFRCEEAFQYEITRGLQKEPDRSKWGVANRGKEDEAWWRAEAPKMVQRWLDWQETTNLVIADLPNGTAGIEVEFTISQYGPAFKGGIDRIMRDKGTGVHGLLDIKTGKNEPKSPFQLAMYRDALQELFGVEIQWGWYWMGRTGKLGQPFDLTKITPEHTMNMVAGTRQMIEQEIFIPNVSMLCGSCGVREYCYAVGGDESLLRGGVS